MPKRIQPGLPFADPSTAGRDTSAAARSGAVSAGDPLLAQLEQLCRRAPTRAKWLIVPARATGLAVADRLAREAGAWANLRVVTPLDLAIRMAAPVLLERGITPSEERVGPPLVMRLLRGLDVQPHYFRALADQPSLASALWRTLRELRFAGIAPGDVPPSAIGSQAKHAEVVALLSAYERWLAEERVADAAMVFATAAAATDYCPVTPSDLRVEWPHAVWEPIVRRFLDVLPGERIDADAIEIAGSPRTARARAFGAPVRFVVPANERAAARLRHLRAPGGVSAVPAGDASLELFHAGGRHAEIDEIARRVVSLARPLDHVEITCASEDHAWMAWEKCVRLGLKVTLSSGVPVLTTAPGRALVGWCNWVDANFSGSAMRRLLLSGAVAPKAWAETEGSRALSPTRAARLLAEAEPSWGRATWAASLDAFAAQEAKRAADTNDDETRRQWRLARSRDARRVGEWVAELLHSLPGDPGEATLGATIAAARAFVADNAAVRTPADGLARALLLEMLDGFAAIGDQPWSVNDTLRLVRNEAEGLRAGRDRARPGHVHVSTIAEAGDDGRPVVFVAGLEEGRVFPAAHEDPILLDKEREAIDAALGGRGLLRLSSDRQEEAIQRRLERLAAVGASAERVTLSYSCRDIREFRETYASWVLLNAFRLQRGDATLSYRALHDALGDVPASPLPRSAGEATTASEWWMAQARRARGGRQAVLDAHPDLARGVAATEARASDEFTVYDGLVTAAAALDPTKTGRVTSVSTLEKLAACPFRYFLQHGLRVNELEEGEPDADAWLDPLTRGSVLHDIYAKVMRRARDRGGRVNASEDLAWAQSEAREMLERLRVEMPPPSDAILARESDELLDDVELFVRDEQAKTDVEPLGFEVEFGPGASGDEPLNDGRPLELVFASERVLRMRGRIDRIDRLAAGTGYQVLDYKTGYYSRNGYEGVFVRGTRLQPMVYGLAAEQLLQGRDAGARVVRGAYVFPTGRGFRTVKSIDLPAAAETKRVIKLTLDVVASGTFPTTPDEGGCRYCPMERACASAPEDATTRKLASGAALAAFRELQGVK